MPGTWTVIQNEGSPKTSAKASKPEAAASAEARAELPSSTQASTRRLCLPETGAGASCLVFTF